MAPQEVGPPGFSGRLGDRHGLYPGQIDLGWHFIQLLQRLGLAWDVNVPSNLPSREGITALKVQG